MAINLPPDLEEAVARHVSSGNFATAEDVLRAAMDKLDSDDLESLKASLEEEEAGLVKSLNDVAGSIRQKHGFSESA